MTTCMRLLKSWAIPPASMPSASILRVCSRLRSSRIRSVTSIENPIMPPVEWSGATNV